MKGERVEVWAGCVEILQGCDKTLHNIFYTANAKTRAALLTGNSN